MRQKLITLDPTSWDLAAKKPNFSEWVRNQLRAERNKRGEITRNCSYCNRSFLKTEFYDHKCITLDKGWGEEE